MIRLRIAGFALYQWAERRSASVTRRLVCNASKRDRYLCVGGYPKSGTTWISQMVGDALGRPVPRESWHPMLRRGVVHHHWEFVPALRDSIYVVRDGRDVMVSEYVAMMNAALRMQQRLERFGKLSTIERALLLKHGRNARLRERFMKVFGERFDPADRERNFPLFVRESLRRPFSEVNSEPWHRHVQRWAESGRPELTVHYEAMLEDPQRELTRLIQNRLAAPVPAEQIEEAVEQGRFEKVTGRARGSEDPTQFARKGVAGDWLNWFDYQSAAEFDEIAGEALVSTGYLQAAEKGRWFEPLFGR